MSQEKWEYVSKTCYRHSCGAELCKTPGGWSVYWQSHAAKVSHPCTFSNAERILTEWGAL
jgi:hypothetical protein